MKAITKTRIAAGVFFAGVLGVIFSPVFKVAFLLAIVLSGFYVMYLGYTKQI